MHVDRTRGRKGRGKDSGAENKGEQIGRGKVGGRRGESVGGKEKKGRKGRKRSNWKRGVRGKGKENKLKREKEALAGGRQKTYLFRMILLSIN